MKMWKKAWMLVLCVCLALGSMSFTVSAEETNFQIGDYIIMGQYNGTPIVWRYVLDDEHGKLLVTNYILDMKYFGDTNNWQQGYMRRWLNSNERVYNWYFEGEPFYYYGDELGFLSNFTQAQLSLVKPTTQWTMVPNISLSENGLTHIFSSIKVPGRILGHGDYTHPEYYEIDDIPSIYYGAAMQTTDRFFLLDELQVYEMRENIGTVKATLVDSDITPMYWTRSSSDYDGVGLIWGENGLAAFGPRVAEYGIRPAFYLNESAIETMTGSGTAEDPYVLNARNGITVKVNGEFLSFDQDPIIENDRVLVPFRAIFEALGAEVEWEGETQTVTAEKDGLSLTLQIGSDQMTVNGTPVTLDVAPKIVHNRTLVPIRAVSESLNATVDWNNDLRQVIITTE